MRAYVLLILLASFAAGETVSLKRVPDGGIQPQVAIAKDGTVHLLYYKGDPAHGDLFYAASADGDVFSKPIRVNSVPGSAVALGNIRGGRLAVGRNGNVFVVWNGAQHLGDQMLFTRLEKGKTAFEPQRNLITTAHGLDGGGSVAADQRGNVYVFWHAPVPGRRGEENRRVWMARSGDDGATFAPERTVWNEPVGACSCCTLTASVDAAGKVFVLFRSAQAAVHRDIYLLESGDHDGTFRGTDVSPWNLNYCAMTSEAFSFGPYGDFAAWETKKQVHFGKIDAPRVTATDVAVPASAAVQKYPTLAQNGSGALLIAWTEGMAWKRGGELRWSVWREGNLDQHPGTASGVPAFSLVAAYAKRDGSFVVLY